MTDEYVHTLPVFDGKMEMGGVSLVHSSLSFRWSVLLYGEGSRGRDRHTPI